jgi:hypothetical protein
MNVLLVLFVCSFGYLPFFSFSIDHNGRSTHEETLRSNIIEKIEACIALLLNIRAAMWRIDLRSSNHVD